MGLDITAYGKVELLEILSTDDEFEDKYPYGEGKQDDVMFIWPGLYDYPDRLGSVQPGGVYRYQESFDFQAGSYGGYNWWREQLCLMALGIHPKKVWNDPEKYEEAPFYGLINFADNEGIIGPETSAILAKDFANFQEKANTWIAETYFLEGYNDWRKAFELASKSGFVDFH